MQVTSTQAPVSTVAPQAEAPTEPDSAESVGEPPEAPPAEPPAPTEAQPLAVVVNGQPIYLADYERALAQYEGSLQAQGIDPTTSEGQEFLAQRRDWLLTVMIEQMLTEQAAIAADVSVTDEEVNAYIQEMITYTGGEEAYRTELAQWGQTEEDAWQDVRAQLIGGRMTQRVTDAIPTVTEHVHARHILVDTPEEADRILAQLQASADFAALAQAYSHDTSTRDRGGDLGFFPRGVLVSSEVEEVAFALQPGQFSGVILSVLGYHIVQVVERDPARPVGEENLRLLKDTAVQAWIEGLWAQAEIQRYIETTP